MSQDHAGALATAAQRATNLSIWIVACAVEVCVDLATFLLLGFGGRQNEFMETDANVVRARRRSFVYVVPHERRCSALLVRIGVRRVFIGPPAPRFVT